MTDTRREEPEVYLHATTDARVWADEFCKNWPTALCQVPGREGVETEEDFNGIMLSWFANAIMAGVDSVDRTPAPEAGWRGIPISTNERLPEKPGKRSYEHVRCLIFIHGKWEVGMWNCEHLVWDDDEGDDFRYHPTEPTHWMPLPPAPGEPATEQPTRTQQKSFTVALGKSLTIEQPDAVQEARDAVIHEADFLLDRLKQYEADGCQCNRSVREWYGHVSAPMARLEAAQRALSGDE